MIRIALTLTALLWTLPLLAEDFRSILEDAFQRRAEQTYTLRQKTWTGPQLPFKTIPWTVVAQRRNEDGTIWRLEEVTYGKEGKRFQWNISFANAIQRRLLRDGHMHYLRLSKFERFCVRFPYQKPARKIAKSATVSGEPVTEGIRPCWRIRVKSSQGEMTEYLVDQQTQFIIQEVTFDANGNPLTTTESELPQLDQEPGTDLFALPERLTVTDAKDWREVNTILLQWQKRHSRQVAALRDQIQQQAQGNTRRKKDLNVAQNWDLD